MARKTGFDSGAKKRSATFRGELRAAREHINSVDGVGRALMPRASSLG